MSGDPLTPAEVATMKPYEQQQGGWWEYCTDPHGGADWVWRPVVTTLWCGHCAAPFNTEHKDTCKETP